jgi:ATP-dependent Clp protease ATP-binding subunit ClpA
MLLAWRRRPERTASEAVAPLVAELFAAAQVEAIAFRHDFIGTEHVLLALLKREDEAGRALRELGLDTRTVRCDVRRLVGDGPARETVFDADALARVGVDLDAVRERVEASFGEGALERARRGRGRCGGGTAFGVSPRLKRALESARCDAAGSHNEVAATHVLIGLARQRDSVAARILDSHGASLVRITAAFGWRTGELE